MKEILNVIHNTIYQFIDVCSDDEEVPMSDKDKLLLEVNKAICNNLKALEQQPTRPTGKWIEKEDYNLDIYYECSECGADYCIEGDILIHKYCPNCGAKITESEEEND